MEVLGIRTARVMTFLPMEELNPYGKALIPSIVSAFVERYGFLEFPQKLADYDETQGIQFGVGNWNENAIDRVIIYSNGILVDTRVSTDESEAFLKDAMQWLSESLGIQYDEEKFERRAYLSEIIIKSETPLNALNPKLKVFAAELAVKMYEATDQSLEFQTVSVGFGYDPLETKLPLATFRIERLLDTPFDENKYYAIAPFSTQTHVSLLEEFEALLSLSESDSDTASDSANAS